MHNNDNDDDHNNDNMFRNYGDFRPANMYSLRDDDNFFPVPPAILKAVRNKSISWCDLANSEVPFEVLTNLYYGRILEGFGSAGSVAQRMRTPLAPPPSRPIENEADALRYADEIASHVRQEMGSRMGMGRFFQAQEQPWKTVTAADFKFAMGFIDIVPPGMTLTTHESEQEYSYRPRYERALFQRRDKSFFHERVDPRNDTEAREFVLSTSQQRLCWGGCTERQIRNAAAGDAFCCRSVMPRNLYERTAERKREHDKNVRNQRPECPRNSGVYSTISMLNLGQKVPLRVGDNAESYIHMFRFAPLHTEHRVTLARTLNSRSSQRADYNPVNLQRLYISELELGIIGLDSGLQISVDDYKRNLLRQERQRFIASSLAYRKDKIRYMYGSGLYGPPLPSPSQLYHFGAYRLRNISLGRWMATIHPSLIGLPITHKRTSRRLYARV